MSAEDLSQLETIVKAGKQMLLWRQDSVYYQINSIKTQRNGSVICELEDGQHASLDDPSITLADFVLGKAIEPNPA